MDVMWYELSPLTPLSPTSHLSRHRRRWVVWEQWCPWTCTGREPPGPSRFSPARRASATTGEFLQQSIVGKITSISSQPNYTLQGTHEQKQLSCSEMWVCGQTHGHRVTATITTCELSVTVSMCSSVFYSLFSNYFPQQLIIVPRKYCHSFDKGRSSNLYTIVTGILLFLFPLSSCSPLPISLSLLSSSTSGSYNAQFTL